MEITILAALFVFGMFCAGVAAFTNSRSLFLFSGITFILLGVLLIQGYEVPVGQQVNYNYINLTEMTGPTSETRAFVNFTNSTTRFATINQNTTFTGALTTTPNQHYQSIPIFFIVVGLALALVAAIPFLKQDNSP